MSPCHGFLPELARDGSAEVIDLLPGKKVVGLKFDCRKDILMHHRVNFHLKKMEKGDFPKTYEFKIFEGDSKNPTQVIILKEHT